MNSNSTGDHAFMWSGTADSAVDLSPLLPFSAVDSHAYSIDAHGNVFGVASDLNGTVHAVEWSPVPEPSTRDASDNGKYLFRSVATGKNSLCRTTCPSREICNAAGLVYSTDNLHDG